MAYDAEIITPTEVLSMPIGPVEYMVVSFPGNRFNGAIAPALAELVESGTVHIIDLTFVHRDGDGNITGLELEDEGSEVLNAFQALTRDCSSLANDDDVRLIGESLEPNSSAAILIWEDLWAARLAGAIRDAGGEVLDIERIPHDIVQAAIDYNTGGARS